MKKRNNAKTIFKIVWVCIAVFFVFAFFNGVSKDKSRENKNKEAKASTAPKETKETGKAESKKTKKEEPKKTEKPKAKKRDGKKEYINSCKKYNYKKVLRNPKKYIGKKVKVKLKISSVHEESIFNDKYYLCNAKGDYGWYGNEYAIYEKRKAQEPKLLEDDIIEVYGTIEEPEETTSLIVNSSEVFVINMKYVKLIEE